MTKRYTVADLIEFLKTQDQEAIVQVAEFSEGSGWESGGHCNEVEFRPDDHIEYVDFRGNPWVTPDKPWFNQRTLTIGRC